MSDYEVMELEKDAHEIDLDDLAGDVSVCMQAPECTDASDPVG